MHKTPTQLKATIMRRVFYAFAVRAATHPVVLHGAFLGICFVLFTHFVSIPNVWANMLDQKLGDIHLFLFNSVLSTEIWTVLFFVLMCVGAVSFWLQLRGKDETRFQGEMAYGQ